MIDNKSTAWSAYCYKKETAVNKECQNYLGTKH